MNWTLHHLHGNKDELLATKKISKYFPVTPPEEHIHVVIKSPLLLSLEEALSLIPPPIIYSPGCTTSKAITKANGGPPTRVLLWEDFFGENSLMELNHQTMNKENVLEVCLGFIPVRIRTPGNSAHLLLPPEILLPEPHIKTVNIVLNLLDKYIRRMVAVRIRKFEGQERLDPLQQHL
ncbi:unnamed protein product [Rhizophagus irregularis]|nr:unnamed protein product [Rhizophagus irregularis]CAB4431116.1 unnamed protein product [Rhizophagus irregularis]